MVENRLYFSNLGLLYKRAAFKLCERDDRLLQLYIDITGPGPGLVLGPL